MMTISKCFKLWFINLICYRETLFSNIQNNELEFTPSDSKNLSPVVKDLLAKLLNKDPNRRLGNICGIRDIKSHPFFNDIDWKLVKEKKMTPPPAYLSEMAMDII